ncbi:MAG: hypothetical protein R3E35_05125 [Rhodocyclaceae bacterium]
MTVLRRHQRRWLVLLALGAALLAEGLFRSGALNPVEQRLQDAWFQWQGKRAEARHVVIVAIDEDTLEAFPDDPMVFWTDRLARAVCRKYSSPCSFILKSTRQILRAYLTFSKVVVWLYLLVILEIFTLSSVGSKSQKPAPLVEIK